MNPRENDTGPVTVIVKRRVIPGREKEYEAWYSCFIGRAKAFDGFRGVDIIRPSGDNAHEYTFIVRFDSYAHLQAWEGSPVRAEWLERSRGLAEENMSIEKFSGIEYWFTLPDRPAAAPPPRYKMALVTILVVTPVSLILSPLLSPLLRHTHYIIGSLIFTTILITLLTYVLMPIATKLLARWLFSREKNT